MDNYFPSGLRRRIYKMHLFSTGNLQKMQILKLCVNSVVRSNKMIRLETAEYFIFFRLPSLPNQGAVERKCPIWHIRNLYESEKFKDLAFRMDMEL